MTEEPTTTRPMKRYYIVGDWVEKRQVGHETVRVLVAFEANEDMISLAVEGAIAICTRNPDFLLADVMAGKHNPDRSPPSEKATAAPRKPTNLVLAIAQVMAEQKVRLIRHSGEKLNKEQVAEIQARELISAGAMTKDRKDHAAKNMHVRIALAKLSGNDTPLEDLFAATDPDGDAAQLDEAAD